MLKKRILALLTTVFVLTASVGATSVAAETTTPTAVEISTTATTTIQLEGYKDYVKASTGVATLDNSDTVLAVSGALTDANNYIVDVPINVTKTGVYKLQYRVTVHTNGFTTSQILTSNNTKVMDVNTDTFVDDGTMRATTWQAARIYSRDIYLEANANEVLKIKSSIASPKIGIDYIKLTPVPIETVQISGDEATTIEAETYSLLFGKGASVKTDKANYSDTGYVYVSDTSRTTATVTVPVNVEKGGKYKVEFKTVWSGNESKTWLGVTNASGVVETVHVDSGKYVGDGAFRKYYKAEVLLEAGEQEITFNIGKGDAGKLGASQIDAYIDSAIFTPIKPETVEISESSNTTINFVDYAGFVPGATTCNGNIRFYNETNLEDKIIEVPVSIVKDGKYDVELFTGYAGGVSPVKMYLVDGSGTSTALISTDNAAINAGETSCATHSINVRRGYKLADLTAGNYTLKVVVEEAKISDTKSIINSEIKSLKITPVADNEPVKVIAHGLNAFKGNKPTVIVRATADAESVAVIVANYVDGVLDDCRFIKDIKQSANGTDSTKLKAGINYADYTAFANAGTIRTFVWKADTLVPLTIAE